MTYWMVRKNDMTFLRPLSQEELAKKIQLGELDADDEVCPGVGYWFSLKDSTEVRKFFGDIDLEKLYSKGKEEITSKTATVKTLGKTLGKTLRKTLGKTNPTIERPKIEIEINEVHLKKATFPADNGFKGFEPKREEDDDLGVEPGFYLKGTIIVLAVFSAFILILITFWLSTY